MEMRQTERKGIDAHRRDANRERTGKPDEADEIKIENQDWLHCSTSEQSGRETNLLLFHLGKVEPLNSFHFEAPLIGKLHIYSLGKYTFLS